MIKVFVIACERRDWSKRKSPKSRRYLIICEDLQVSKKIRASFGPPNKIHIHESGEPFIFYLIANASILRGKLVIKAIKYKLRDLNKELYFYSVE